MRYFKFSDQDVLMKDELTQEDRSIFLDNKKIVDLNVEVAHENAWAIFNKTPSKILPILPPGHHWTYYNGRRSIIAESSPGARFPQQDCLIAAYMAGDREFETSGRKMHAGICADRQGEASTGNAYIKRSLFFATKLSELDDKRPLFSFLPSSCPDRIFEKCLMDLGTPALFQRSDRGKLTVIWALLVRVI